MSKFDVLDGGMAERRLDDANIEALVDGQPVAEVSAQLTELLAAMRDHAETDVPVSAALNEFFVAGTPSGAHSAVSGDGVTVLSLRRRRVSSLAKAASAVGLVPVLLMIGVTMVAAAALGGAHMAGLVDVPLLPGRSARSEVNLPPPPRADPVSPSGASHMGALDPGTNEQRDADTTSKPPVAVATTRQPSPVESVPTDRRSAPIVLPESAAVEGSPGCEPGQESSNPQSVPSTTTSTARISTAPDPQADQPIDPCEPASSTVAPVPHANDSNSDAPDHDATVPRDASPPPGRPPVDVAPVTPPPVTPPSVTPPTARPTAPPRPPRTP